ncbi:UDP-rhamnose/UDP-galactose transporter 3 [Musa acuminata AAA Group]|uniref:UDP-rhamnose/UDP-galactose transporter 3 n=1 Tax=Musa acuminata AAA Group TaxID=214697 RepID=UPI0031E1883D
MSEGGKVTEVNYVCQTPSSSFYVLRRSYPSSHSFTSWNSPTHPRSPPLLLPPSPTCGLREVNYSNPIREAGAMEDGKSLSAVSNVGAWAMNVVSSVGIIMANKHLLSANDYAFTFATTLTGFHFAVTALAGLVSNATGFSASKHVPLWELLWFSLVANLSITGMNLSLMLNSVGFYQISKLSMIPVVCVMEWILHGKQYSKEVKMAVVVVVVGVGVCTVTDVKVNAKGFFCACAAVVSSSFQQISIGSLQKKYAIGSFELLSKTAPMQALSLVSLGPIIDYCLNGKSILKYEFSPGAIIFILLSCLLAVFCNISQYLCIGRFSAVSFQVLGHMKTVCVLILGWLLFDSELTLNNIMGMAIAVIGMVVYSWAVESEKQAKAKFLSKTSLTEEDIRLLKDAVENASVKDVELGETKA